VGAGAGDRARVGSRRCRPTPEQSAHGAVSGAEKDIKRLLIFLAPRAPTSNVSGVGRNTSRDTRCVREREAYSVYRRRKPLSLAALEIANAGTVRTHTHATSECIAINRYAIKRNARPRAECGDRRPGRDAECGRDAIERPGTRPPPGAPPRAPARPERRTPTIYKRSHRATQPRANTQLGARRELSN
jgi:hypothetical protein